MAMMFTEIFSQKNTKAVAGFILKKYPSADLSGFRCRPIWKSFFNVFFSGNICQIFSDWSLSLIIS